MRKSALIIFVILLLMVSACNQNQEFKAITEVIDGIPHITNPAIPLHPNRSIALKEDLVISEEDESGSILLYQPTQFLIDEDEYWFICDHQDQTIKVFDPQGRFVRAFGRKGEGPGEFTNIFGMDFLPDGRLLITDLGARRTSFFDKEGNYLNGHKWRSAYWDLHLTSASFYIMNEIIIGMPTSMFVKKLDLGGNEMFSFGEFIPMAVEIMPRGDTMMSIVVPFKPRSIIVGDSKNQRLYHCLNDKYLIEAYDSAGTILKKIRRQYDPVPFTEKDALEFYASHDRESPAFGEMAREIPLPNFKTITNRMMVDDAGNLWIELQEKREEKNQEQTAYDIFDPEGMYLAKVWLEVIPQKILKEKLYTMAEDEEGYTTLKRYTIIWID